MTGFPRHLFGTSRGGTRRRLAERRVLGLEQLDKRQVMSVNAMTSFATAESGLTRDIRSEFQQAAETLQAQELLGHAAVRANKVAEPIAELPTVQFRMVEQLSPPGRGEAARRDNVGSAASPAVPTVSLVNRVLQIMGTEGTDTIKVQLIGDRVKITAADGQQLGLAKGAEAFMVEGNTVSIAAAAVTRISIATKGGNDDVLAVLNESLGNRLTRVNVDAGEGNDKVKIVASAEMAKKVFANLGKGTDTLEIAAATTLGSQQQTECVTRLATVGLNQYLDTKQFLLADKNCDGFLNKVEYVDFRMSLVQHFNKPSAADEAMERNGFKRMFGMLDIDKDGLLSRPDVVENKCFSEVVHPPFCRLPISLR